MSNTLNNDVDAGTAALKPEAGSAGWGVLWTFTLTTFLSATLLFSVQPMFAKMVLPVLGGSPSVWAVALVFFQGALLVGYCYAHGLIRWVPIERTGFVHVAFSALALLALPISLPESWREPPPGDPYFWQLGLFAVAIGLPFVAVAANAPLLQAWFARAGHAHGRDPYFLYAASNLGSLIALLGYPLVLEPVFGLKALAGLWTAGFIALLLALAACFLTVWQRAQMPGGTARLETLETLADEVPAWRDRLTWVGLALVPSALLTAFTTHVATDVASAPLVWVIPLSLYLLTFVIVFRERQIIPFPVLLILHLAALIFALLVLAQTTYETWYVSSLAGVAAFVTSTLVAHRTLYERRPAAAHLTEFYLWMSLGGVLGGLFSALIAPQIFTEVFEYPLLLALTVACRPGALAFFDKHIPISRADVAWALGIALIGAALIAWGARVAGTLEWVFFSYGVTAAIVATLSAALIAFWFYPTRQLVIALVIYLALVILPSGVHRGAAERSYFGVYRVLQSEDGQFNVLQHGTTLHGAQRIRDADGKSVADTRPATYYYPASPMASSVKLVREDLGDAKGHYGVIGLGAGSLACLSEPEEKWRFFEIDPVVVGIARSRNFTFLANCQPESDIVLGDARLTLAKEKDDTFDLLVIDAFSSDAVPMHLLTAEAILLYASKLAPDGVGVLHISNRYLDLEGMLQATIRLVPGIKAFAVEDDKQDTGYEMTGSTIVAFSRDQGSAQRFMRLKGARTLKRQGMRPWTDDSSDILGPFLSRYQGKG